jgi:hypothetical protein
MPPQIDVDIKSTWTSNRHAHPPSGCVSKARSAEFLLPPALAALVAGGVELGEADDKVRSEE